MKKNTLLFIMLILGMLVYADTVILDPTDDMYTDNNHPGVTPTITELWTANYPSTSHYERIMMQFNLQPFEGKTVESAILHLTRFFSCPSSGTTAATMYAINQAWSESTWDYTQHNTYHEDTARNYVFIGSGGNAIVDFEVDISGFVNQWLSGSIENHGLVIIANANQKFSKFYSKEHPNDVYRPHLELEYSPSAVQDDSIEHLPITVSIYPNPFNPQTTISFHISCNSDVNVVILNIRGQKVFQKQLFDLSIGKHEIAWSGIDESGRLLSSGIYLCKITTNTGTVIHKMILQK
jgi:hypothetical protein